MPEDPKRADHPRMMETPLAADLAEPGVHSPSWVSRMLLSLQQMSAQRVFLTSFVALFAVFAVWSLSTAPFGSPDEDQHFKKAAATVRGQIFTPEVMNEDQVVLPDWYADSGTLVCHYKWGEANITGNCPDPSTVEPSETGTKNVMNTAARNQPLYYAIVGLPTLLPGSVATVYLARLLSAAMSALFFAIGFTALRRAGASTLMVMGGLAAFTPMVTYISSMVNPQALEISAGFALWCQMMMILRYPYPDHAHLGRRMWVLAFITFMFVNSRGLSPLFFGIIVIMCVALQPWRHTWAVMKDKRSWAPLAFGTFGCVVALGWIAAMSTLSDATFKVATEPMTTRDVLIQTLKNADEYVVGTMGFFGWMDVLQPIWTYALLGAPFIIMMLLVISFGSWRERWVIIAGGVLACIVLPVLLHVTQYESIGWMWQGRYILPILVGLPIMAGFALTPRLKFPEPAGRQFFATVALMWAALSLWAQIQVLHRYVNGGGGSWHKLVDDAWIPPLGLLPTFLLQLVAAVVLYVFLVRLTPTVEPGALDALDARKGPQA